MRHFFRSVAASALVWVLNRFDGATQSPGRSYIPHTVQSARFEISASSRMEIVRKSQWFEENNALLNRMADLFECYTVGCGLQLNPASSSPEWNKTAKGWLEGWAQYCDNASLQSFGCLQGLMARKWFVDGEIFIALVNGESNRPRLQLIETHLVATPPDLKHMEGKTVIDGIQIDERGRPIGYYIAEEDARGKKIWRSPKPAELVIHLFEPTRPGQYRGLPFCYPVINILHDLEELMRLEMKRAKDAAEITNVVKTKTGEMPNAESLIKQAFTQSRTLSTGQDATEQKQAWYRESIGGRTVALYRGDELEQFKSETPSVATREYWKLLMEWGTAGTGVPFCLCFPESMQGTVYRGALDMAALWFSVRSEVIQYALRRIYQTHVMKWAIKNVAELRNPPPDWHKVTIRPPRAPNVDVGRNSAAMLAELAVGATNLERIFAPLGLDWREELDKLKEQLEYAKREGILDLLAELAKAQKPVAPVNEQPKQNEANGRHVAVAA